MLAACADHSLYTKDGSQRFEPREYYRSAVSRDSVGAVLFKTDDRIEKVKLTLLQVDGVKDSVVLSDGELTIIAVQPKAYERLKEDELLQQIHDQFHQMEMIKVTADPEHFRKMKQLRDERAENRYDVWSEAVKQLFIAIEQ